MKTALDMLLQGIASKSLRLLIIGGHALQSYGLVRQTFDLDCLVSDKSLPALRDILAQIGYREISKTDNFARFRHKSPYFIDMDVLLVDSSTFEKLYKDSREYSDDLPGLRVPLLQHLIALKLHAIKNSPSRETRDLSDIKELLRINPKAISGKELEKLCKQFGPAGIMEKLKGNHENAPSSEI